jgi:hypothetical protein
MSTRNSLVALAFGALALVAWVPPGTAAEGKARRAAASGSLQPTGAYGYQRKRAPIARRYAGRRIGFYSYTYRDVINTYGMSRSLYGGINSFRDPYVDRQTPNGPFDHGFFFDSAIEPRGGNAPYLR